MSFAAHNGLSRRHRPVIMRGSPLFASAALLWLMGEAAQAQQPSQRARDDLDVTMQIIVDPDAKLPDEVVRRIPLPARKPAEPPSEQSSPSTDKPDKTDRSEAAAPGKESSREAREHGREVSEAAQERSREAAEQREAARRSAAEERRRERGPPDDRGRPERPPRR